MKRQESFLDIIELSEYKDLTIKEMIQKIQQSDCTRCRRAEFRQTDERYHITIARGVAEAKVWVVGKSPGIKDSIEGLPFSYGSGDTLERMLASAGLDPKKDVLMTNPVFCPMTNDATPTTKELESCSKLFSELVRVGSPRVFVSLGSVASKSIIKNVDQKSFEELCGQSNPFESHYNDKTERAIPVFVVYHPAFFSKQSPLVQEAKAKSYTTLKAPLPGARKRTPGRCFRAFRGSRDWYIACIVVTGVFQGQDDRRGGLRRRRRRNPLGRHR